MSEEEKLIKEKIEELREYLEYGMDYSEYLDIVNAFDYIENLIITQKAKIYVLQEENKALKEQLLYMQATDNKDILKHWRKK